MQLLVIRHALPLRSEPGQGSDPELSEDGIEQAKRLPDALARFPIARLVSSPQRRAIQTAQPVADALGLTVDVDDRVAEYDRDLDALHADRGGLAGRPAAAHRRTSARRGRRGCVHRSGQGRRRRHRRRCRPRGHRRAVQPRRRHQRAGARHHADRATAVRPGRLRGRHPAAVVARPASSASRRSTGPSTYGICCRGIFSGERLREPPIGPVVDKSRDHGCLLDAGRSRPRRPRRAPALDRHPALR